MKKTILIMLISLFVPIFAFATDEAYESRMSRNRAYADAEIMYYRERKLLELRAEIYAQELALQRAEVKVNNSTSLKTTTSSNASAEASASNDRIRVYNKNV